MSQKIWCVSYPVAFCFDDNQGNDTGDMSSYLVYIVDVCKYKKG